MGNSRNDHQSDVDIFADLENLKIPDYELPPVKIRTLKEIQEDSERDRKKQMEEREKFYKSRMTECMNFVCDAEFLSRSRKPFVPVPKKENEPNPVRDIIQEDLESYQTDIKQEPFNEALDEKFEFSAFDRISIPRKLIGFKNEDIIGLTTKNKMLDRFMDNRNMARIPNGPKRIAKGEKANLLLTRYNAEEVKQRVADKEEDLFGYLNLVPLTLSKTSESAIERKRKLINRFQCMMFDFDYADREEQHQQYEEYEKLTKRIDEISEILAAHEKKKRECALQKKQAAEEKPGKVSRKRKRKEWEDRFDQSIDEYILGCDENLKQHEQLIEEETRKARIVSKEAAFKKMAATDAKNKNAELKKKKYEEEVKEKKAEQLEAERKREEAAAKRAEDLRIQREAEEKRERQFEEEQRKQEEVKRLQEEEMKRRQEEEFKKEQEIRAALMKKMEEKRRADEEKRKKEDLEQIQKQIEAKRKDVETVEVRPQVVASTSLPAIIYQKEFNYLKVALPKEFHEFKEMYRKHYNIPTEINHRTLEINEIYPMEPVRSPNDPAAKPPNIIPAHNTAITKTFILLEPVGKNSKKVSAVVDNIPDVPTANNQEIKDTLDKLKAMVRRRKHFALDLSPQEREIDYQKINLHELKSALVYPFHQSDGMYWPVFFGLPTTDKNPNREHVEAYTKCNSYSGKYASYLLLTTTSAEDEDQEKKFDESYHDSDGDWAEYSRKPGRFANRMGFKAKNGCTEDFEVQKERAVDRYRLDFEAETRSMNELENYRRQFAQDGNRERYDEHMKSHLSQLVRDFRIDIYSAKEDWSDHPGTRECPLDPRWHNHGYNRFVKTRDDTFADHMYDVTKNYEYLLPPITEKDEFEEWCLTPMLASLYYQAYYDTFNVLPKEEMADMEDRRKKYLAMLTARQFNLEEALKVCSMTLSDKKQWTFLYDQLVAHFREFPGLCQLMYDKDLNLHCCAQRAIEQVMITIHEENSNQWVL